MKKIILLLIILSAFASGIKAQSKKADSSYCAICKSRYPTISAEGYFVSHCHWPLADTVAIKQRKKKIN